MKTSFFKDYILYRMKGLLGFFITSCVLCLVGGPLPITIVSISLALENSLSHSIFGGYFSFYGVILSGYAVAISIPVLITIAAIMPAVTRRYLNRRNCVDTFGALPLTYKQRYWGDLLAEIAAYVTPIIPAGIYTCIMMAVLVNNDRYQELEGFLGVTVSVFFTVLICVAGAIALSGSMTQCCGKAGSGVLYTFIAGFAVPILTILFVNILENNALGITSLSMAYPACSAIPPFGALISAYTSLFDGDFSPDKLAVNSPISLVVMLAIIAALIIGGYYIGKLRKAELVGEGMLFKPFSVLISAAAALTITGLIFGLTFESDSGNAVIVIVVSFIIFMVFELITKRRGIRILKSVIIFVCAAAVMIGYNLLVRNTESFGLGDHIPSVNSVREITINFDYRNNGDHYIDEELNFDDKKAMQIIIDQHKKLLNSKDKLSDGNSLEISYKLKNGATVTRSYYIKHTYETLIDEFLGEVLLLPQSGINRYTILTRDDIEVAVAAIYHSDIMGDEGYAEHTVKPEKTDELRRLLYEDINDNFEEFIKKDFEKDYFAELYVDGKGYDEDPYAASNIEGYRYIIPYSYKRTISFLSDPANLVPPEETKSEFSINDKFQIRYDHDGVEIFVNFPDKDKTPIPEELFNILTPEEEGVEYSERFEISFYNKDRGGNLYIRKSDEKRASEILFKVLENYKPEESKPYGYNIFTGTYTHLLTDNSAF